MAAIRLHEDFNKLRNINKQLVQTDFLTEWNFRLDIPMKDMNAWHKLKNIDLLKNTKFQVWKDYRHLRNKENFTEFDLDFYIKDITYGIVDIATDESKFGAASYVWPTGCNARRISFTCRDNRDGRVQYFTWTVFYVVP